MIFTIRMSAKNKVDARKIRRGRLSVSSIDVTDETIVGMSGKKLSVGGKRRKVVKKEVNVSSKVIDGAFMGIGRFGQSAMKYENMTSRPPT